MMGVNSHIDDSEAGQAEHQKPAQIDVVGENDVDWDCAELKQARRQDGVAVLPGDKAAHAPEEQHGQTGQAEDADAGYEREQAAEREIAVRKRAQINDGAAKVRLRITKPMPGQHGDQGADRDGVVIEPVPPVSLLQNIIEATEAERPSGPCQGSPRL